MKTLILLFAIITTTAASATTLHPDTFLRTAELRTWDFDQDSHLKDLDITGGRLRVNAVRKQLSLVFDLAWSCPPNALCAMVMPEHRIDLPIVEIKRDSCGVVTYKAERNMMPADGTHQIITVKDNTHSVCEILYPAPTIITYSVAFYNRMSAEVINQKSFFLADQIKSPFIR